MQATLSSFTSYGYNTCTVYEHPLDTSAIKARYATSSCRDEPPHDPTAPKYDPLHILSKPTPVEWVKPEYRRPTFILAATPPPIDHTFTPRDPRAIGMAGATPPRTLAWAKDQGKNEQCLWALSALSLAHDPWAANYEHFWGEDARDETALFVCGARAHGLMRMTRTDPPINNNSELCRDVLRAYQNYEEALKPLVAETPTRASPRVAQKKRKAVIEAAKESVEEAINAAESNGASSSSRKRTRTVTPPKRAAARSSPHAPAVSSPLAQSMLLPPADIEMSSELTRAIQRPSTKSKLARDAEELAATSADEATSAEHGAATSSASSDDTVVPSSPTGSVKATGKRSRSGSASSATATVDVVDELEKDEVRPAKKPRQKKQSGAGQAPENEAASTLEEAAKKTAKASTRKRATRKR